MTPYERRHPEVIKASRKRRIAAGSARSVEEVNRLIKQFEQMKKMMKQMRNGNFKMPFQVFSFVLVINNLFKINYWTYYKLDKGDKYVI